MVLRYAAPALGLIVVAAIGFMVLRRESRSPNVVTQVTNNDQRPSALPTAEPTGTAYDSLAKTGPSPEALADRQSKSKQQEQAAPPPPNAPPVVSSVEANASKDKAEQPKPQIATANEPAPPPKTEPAATPEERQKNADIEANKKEVREMPATTAAPAAQRAVRAEEEKDRNTNNFSRPPKASDKVSGIASAGSVADLKRDDLRANTRSVAGRRFQKKGGVWIDTAYDSSKDTVTVTRGSEQYRALVADEPSIKTIADELDGEIIVVWKGHTYRIR